MNKKKFIIISLLVIILSSFTIYSIIIIAKLYNFFQKIYTTNKELPTPPKSKRIDFISAYNYLKNLVENINGPTSSSQTSNITSVISNVQHIKSEPNYKFLSSNLPNTILYVSFSYSEINSLLSKLYGYPYFGFFLHRLFILGNKNNISIYIFGSGWFLERLAFRIDIKISDDNHQIINLNVHNKSLLNIENINSKPIYRYIYTIYINGVSIDPQTNYIMYKLIMFYLESWLQNLLLKFGINFFDFISNIKIISITDDQITISTTHSLLAKLFRVIRLQ